MQLDHTFTVPADIDTVWAALMDPERVAPCMPGATLTEYAGTTFAGTVKVKLGPVSMVYKGTGEFIETDEDTHRATIKAAGKDSRGNGTAAATIAVALTANGASTTGKVTTDLAITGKPAQFGRGMIAEVGGKILEAFATCLAARLATATDVSNPNGKAPNTKDIQPAPKANRAVPAKPGPPPNTAKPTVAPKPTAAPSPSAVTGANPDTANPAATANPAVTAKPTASAQPAVTAKPTVPAKPTATAKRPKSAKSSPPESVAGEQATGMADPQAQHESTESTPISAKPDSAVAGLPPDQRTPSQTASADSAPTAAAPTSAESGAAEPEAAEPEAAKPEAAEPEAAKPEAAKPERPPRQLHAVPDSAPPIDLLEFAGPSVGKRLLPVAVALLVVAVVVLRRRR